MSDKKDRKHNSLSRRKFMRLVGGSAACVGVAGCLPATDGDWNRCLEAPFELDPSLIPRSNRVVEVFAEGAVTLDEDYRATFHQEVITAMWAAGLAALTGEATQEAAWALILPEYQPGERIGLKANALAPGVPSRPELLTAIHDSLRLDFQVGAEDVFVWDRTIRELERAKITDLTGVTCLGTFQSATDTSGPGYDDRTVCLSGQEIQLSKVHTEQTQHMINVAVMKRHTVSGFTGCMKNNYGLFSNPWDFHDDTHLHIARLNAIPEVAGTTRLLVLDALRGVCIGDTNAPQPDCSPRKLLLSFDPVAIDQRGLELRDEARMAEHGEGPAEPADYIQEAEAMGLGTRAYELVNVAI